MSKITIADFRVRKGDKDFNLASFPTKLKKQPYKDEQDYERKLGKAKARMSEIQELLFASKKGGLAFGLQAMDAGGKDGLIEHVLTGCNPQGVAFTSFKRPTEAEFKQHFLQRHEAALPPTGFIAVWNRTHLEEVGTVRVHPEFLRARDIDPKRANKKFWNARLQEIADFEARAHERGIPVVKIFLHISKKEQARRLLARAEDPKKHFKFNPGDMAERKLWAKYMQAYTRAFVATSTKDCPVYVIPADDKRTARLIAAKIVVKHLERADPKPQPLDKAGRKAIKGAIRELKKELGRD